MYLEFGVPIHQMFLVLSVNFLFIATPQKEIAWSGSKT